MRSSRVDHHVSSCCFSIAFVLYILPSRTRNPRSRKCYRLYRRLSCCSDDPVIQYYLLIKDNYIDDKDTKAINMTQATSDRCQEPVHIVVDAIIQLQSTGCIILAFSPRSLSDYQTRPWPVTWSQKMSPVTPFRVSKVDDIPHAGLYIEFRICSIRRYSSIHVGIK